MKPPTVYLVIMLAATVLATGCQVFQGGGAGAADGWTSNIAGSYKGIIYTGQTEYPGTTTFAMDDKGMLKGTYALDENGTTVPGTLTDFREVGPRKLTCTWHDKNGSGPFVLTFTEDLSAFDGLWSNAGQPPTHGWNGKK